jgi:dienelactone hydrolase
MRTTYTDLGVYSDWVAAGHANAHLFGPAAAGQPTQSQVREILGFCRSSEMGRDVRVERAWSHDGLLGEEVSWSVGYGPRTQAWVLRPAGQDGPLPGIVALHDHGGFKYLGKGKVARGPSDPPGYVTDYYWPTYYGGRPFANALARVGFVVLVHDAFLWGSRRFPLDLMPEWAPAAFDSLDPTAQQMGVVPHDVGQYNFAAAQHEHVIEKYCNLLGTTMAGVVCYEDRVALNYLRARHDVDPERVGCIGLSGGGNRAGLLQASYDPLRAAAIVGLMSTYPGLLDHNVATHTWMFFPSGWARHGDWPDLVGCRAPSPLLVQYDLEDDLFTPEGMRAAHERLATIYAEAGERNAYTGQFFPGPHKFDLDMQRAAFAWLKEVLGA